MSLLRQYIAFGVSPLGLVAVLLILGLLLCLFRRYRNRGRRLLALGALLYAFYIFSPLAEILTRNLEKQYRPMLRPNPNLKIERVVILSDYGEESRSQLPVISLSEAGMSRIFEGIRLYRQIPGAKLIISGGVVRKGDRPIADIMATVAQQMGVPAADIIVERSSINTRTNLIHTKILIGSAPFILVTTASHLPRAMGVARKLEMNAVPAPAGIWALQNYPPQMTLRQWTKAILLGFSRPSHGRIVQLQRVSHEYVGMVWYRMQGWL
jgi:uncharacterized SAM-binding protein YcdF (DUF218 family)